MNKQVTGNIQQIIELFVSETKLEKRKPRTEKTKAITSAIIGLLTTDNVKLINIARPNDKSKTIKKISLEQNARRLLDDTSISSATYAKILINKILHLDTFEVIIDRTNWQWGNSDINYFVASVIWNNIAIPLYWQLLDNKGGSSNDLQRIQIIQWIVDVFGESRILNVYADREFPSHMFLSFLVNDSNTCTNYIELNEHQAHKLFSQIEPTSNITSIHYKHIKSSDIELNHRLNLIEFNNNVLLIEKLETQFCKFYQLNNPSDFIKIRQKYLANNVKITPNELSILFDKYHTRDTIGFVQRCKESTVIKFGDIKLTAKQLHQNIHKHGNIYIANKICRAFGHRVYISAHLNQRNEYVFIVSDKPHKNPFQLYKRRWSIEVLFAKLKTVGFNIESTHITNHNRLFNLLQLISIAYTLCCKIGSTYNLKIKPIKMKKFKKIHNNCIELRMQLSVFKLGFELLKNFINNHLFCTLTMANLMLKIIDSDIHLLKLDKRSHYIQLIASFQ